MRRFLYAIAFLVFLPSELAFACKPYFWAPKEVAQQARVIFVAEVVKTFHQNTDADLVELKVSRVLKGAVPDLVTTESYNIRAMGDACAAINAPGTKRKINVGEVWIISGRFQLPSNRFEPFAWAIPFEPNTKYFTELVRELKRVGPKNN